MKIVFVLAFLVGVALAEDCQTVTDCTHVSCPERDYVLICDHTICSCKQTTQHTCILPADCQNVGSHCNRDFHCVDNTCRCGHGFGPGGK